MHQLKDISTKLAARTRSTHEVKVEQCAWCEDFGHSSIMCPNYGDIEGGEEQAKVVYQGFNGNFGQNKRFEPNANTYNVGARHPNFSWRSTNALQPNEGLQVPRPAFNQGPRQQGQ